MEAIHWKVEGMSCSNCALTIQKFLEKNGMNDVKVNFAAGELSFELNGNNTKDQIKKGIADLGYHVAEDDGASQTGKKPANKFLRYLYICTPFTLLLMLHMVGPRLHLPWLMNPWLQLALCIPVYIAGMGFFGKSAIQSIRNGIPNMNVLIALGATAAFFYSLAGTILHLGESYLYYETAAAIITLVFLGNYLEDISVQSTQKALNPVSYTHLTLPTKRIV